MLIEVSGVVPDYYFSVYSITLLFISPYFLLFPQMDLSIVRAGILDMHCLSQVHCSKNSTFSQVHMRKIYFPSVGVARYGST